MRMEVIGKALKQGTNRKTNTPYSATVVYATYPMAGVEGAACEDIWVDSALMPFERIYVGSIYDVDRDGRGFLIGFVPVD